MSDLLRASLNSAGEEEVPLSRELSVLAHYVDIQQVRFGDRLEMAIDAPADVQGALVPNLILQPLVENAIRHGLASRLSGGRITVSARRAPHSRLRVDVSDNGVGESPGSTRREGVGLGNTRARLQQLYGTDHHFEAKGTSEGFFVHFDLPYRLASGERPSEVLA